ncbi:MAG: CoB--CoM heterodisulfide reductase iron-sulfur subunit A family protein [Chloroflexota bacterium]|nr:CoB--CoM heterodisulfide reductase iron-sulfur subunit A family protein [Chloroflexota bacterium]
MSAAFQIAEAGKQVFLVEKEPTLGGHMAKFDKTFPTLDCAACILTPKMAQVGSHPNIQVLTCSEVSKVEGHVGSFRVTVTRRPRFIIEEKCTGCGECIAGCVYKDARFPDEFSLGLGRRKPIYFSFAQAIPRMPVIDPETCIFMKSGKCPSGCVKACGDRQAIDLRQQPQELILHAGAIVVSTGFQIFNPKLLTQYGYGQYPNVYTALEVEQLLNAGGPTNGKLLLRDGGQPKSVAILHCIGSRDDNTNVWCSRVCCMYSLKLAHLVKEKAHDAQVYNFYIDIRAPGKGFEEFYRRVLNEGVNFVRGKAACVTTLAEAPQEEGKLVVVAEDTLLQMIRRVPVDMVILSTGLEARKDFEGLRRVLNISASADGFARERHPKLAPVSTFTDGILVAGCAQGPKDIPDTIAQAEAAAAEALALIDRGSYALEPNTAWVDEARCTGCRICVGLCSYNAIEFNSERDVAVVNEVLCKGCGTCVAACPTQALNQHLFTTEQLMAEMEGVLR